jgi:hypothetical protein
MKSIGDQERIRERVERMAAPDVLRPIAANKTRSAQSQTSIGVFRPSTNASLPKSERHKTGKGHKMTRLLPTAMITIFAFTLSACIPNRTDLEDSGTVNVRIDDGPGSPVQYVMVYSEPDDSRSETIIRGKVTGTAVPYYRTYGKHVHIEVISPDGQVIVHEDPRLRWQTRSKFRTATAKFIVRLPEAVPIGTVVDVVFHDASDGGALHKQSAKS